MLLRKLKLLQIHFLTPVSSFPCFLFIYFSNSGNCIVFIVVFGKRFGPCGGIKVLNIEKGEKKWT